MVGMKRHSLLLQGDGRTAAAIDATGRAPANARESAIIAELPVGDYTAILSGVGGTSGVGLIEVYEVD
jgi:hypothetical protein